MANPSTLFALLLSFLAITALGIVIGRCWHSISRRYAIQPSERTVVGNAPIDEIGRVKPKSFQATHIIFKNHRFKSPLVLMVLYTMFFVSGAVTTLMKQEYMFAMCFFVLSIVTGYIAKRELTYFTGPKFFELSTNGIWIDKYNYYIPRSFFASLHTTIVTHPQIKNSLTFYTFSLRIKIPLNKKDYYIDKGIYSPAIPESKTDLYCFTTIPLFPMTEANSISKSVEEIYELFKAFREEGEP